MVEFAHCVIFTNHESSMTIGKLLSTKSLITLITSSHFQKRMYVYKNLYYYDVIEFYVEMNEKLQRTR